MQKPKTFEPLQAKDDKEEKVNTDRSIDELVELGKLLAKEVMKENGDQIDKIADQSKVFYSLISKIIAPKVAEAFKKAPAE